MMEGALINLAPGGSLGLTILGGEIRGYFRRWLCGMERETMDHLFLRCEFDFSLWCHFFHKKWGSLVLPYFFGEVGGGLRMGRCCGI